MMAQCQTSESTDRKGQEQFGVEMCSCHIQEEVDFDTSCIFIDSSVQSVSVRLGIGAETGNAGHASTPTNPDTNMILKIFTTQSAE